MKSEKITAVMLSALSVDMFEFTDFLEIGHLDFKILEKKLSSCIMRTKGPSFCGAYEYKMKYNS